MIVKNQKFSFSEKQIILFKNEVSSGSAYTYTSKPSGGLDVGPWTEREGARSWKLGGNDGDA
jgi:hypothetical protein